MPGKTIAMFNLNETRRDPRVRRVAGTLTQMGHRVTIFGIQGESDPERERLDGFEIVRVPVPQSYTAEDMAAFGRLCPAAAETIASCDLEVMARKAGLLARQYHRGKRCLGQWSRRLFRWNCSECGPPRFDPLQEVLAIRWVLLLNLTLYRKAAEFSPAIAHANDLDTLLAAWLLKTTRRATLIYDAHEIYPEQLPVHMRSDLWHRFYTRLEKSLLPHTDGRLTVCDSLAEYFGKTYGAGPFLVLRNCPPQAARVAESLLDRRNAPRRITYHGAYYRYRGLDEMLQAARTVENAHFIFRGFGPHEPALRRKAAELKLEDRVTFAPPVDVDELVSSAGECDIGLCPFISVCRNTEFALPNKFFEYMAAGLALVSADLVEMRSLTRKHRLGVVYDSNRAQTLSDTLNEMIADPERLDAYRRNAYAAARDEFHWEREQQRLQAYYRDVLA